MLTKKEICSLMHDIDRAIAIPMIGLLLIIIGCQFAKTLNAQAIPQDRPMITDYSAKR